MLYFLNSLLNWIISLFLKSRELYVNAKSYKKEGNGAFLKCLKPMHVLDLVYTLAVWSEVGPTWWMTNNATIFLKK